MRPGLCLCATGEISPSCISSGGGGRVVTNGGRGGTVGGRGGTGECLFEVLLLHRCNLAKPSIQLKIIDKSNLFLKGSIFLKNRYFFYPRRV